MSKTNLKHRKIHLDFKIFERDGMMMRRGGKEEILHELVRRHCAHFDDYLFELVILYAQ